MEATSVQVASVLGTACRKCDRVDTAEARRLQSGAVQSTSAISALVASVADPKAFRLGRDFSTWIGLVPKQNSSGGKEKLGSITKRVIDLRSLFTAGVLAVIRYAKIHGINHRSWLTALLARRPTKVAAVALANKLARMAWAMMSKGERCKKPVALNFLAGREHHSGKQRARRACGASPSRDGAFRPEHSAKWADGLRRAGLPE
jgi:Transposase IS116/IS110/IS902 family